MTTPSMTEALRETLAFFDGSREPLTTPEVADRLGLGRRSTYERLERLVDHGRLETKKVGANARVWWRPSETGDDDAAGGSPETPDYGTSVQFRSLIDAVEEYAIFTLDPDGHVETWNAGAERIKGYEAEDVLGEHFSTFYTDEQRAAGVPRRNLEKAADEGWIEDEGWRVREDGTRFWANVTITAIHDDDELLGFTKVTRDMTDRREREQELRRERDLTRQVFETAPTLLGVIESDGTISRTNRRCDRVLGVDEDDALAVGTADIYDVNGEFVPSDRRPYTQVFETGERVRGWKCQIQLPEGQRRWLTVNAAPIEDGESGVDRVVLAGEDVTQIEAQARRLERQRDDLETELDEMFDRIDDAFCALDEEFRFTYVNDRAAELLQHTELELLGQNVWEVFPDATETDAWESFHEAMESQEPTSYELYFETLEFWVEANVYPSESGLSVYFQDVTERKERQQRLRRYETLFQESKDVNVIVDEDGTFRHVTPSAENVLGYEPDELTGEIGFEYIHPDDREEAMAEFTTMLETPGYEPVIEFRFERPDGSWIVLEAMARDLRDDPDVDGLVIYTRDVTDRRNREEKLRQYRTIVETIDDGVYVVDDESRFQLVNEAHTDLTGYDREELLGSHASLVTDQEYVGLAENLRDQARDDDGRAVTVETELLNSDDERVPIETRFSLLELDEDRYGRVGVVRDISERKDRERKLERQREQLAAIDDLNDTVRDIVDAVIEQSSREEIEEIVCDRLAATDSYAFAWIADVDLETKTIRPRVERGVDGYLDTIDLSTAPDEAIGQGPAGRAARTGEIQVSMDVFEDPDFEPWREYAEEYGYRSSAAIPITHEGTLYGILGVYSERAGAFSPTEREVVGQLGEVIGHAIAAIERKQALMSDEVTELELTIPGLLESFDVDPDAGGIVTYERTVSIGDGVFLQYGTVDEAAIATLEAYVDRHPDYGDLTVFDRGEGTARFEFRAVEPPVSSAVAARGGYLHRARIEDGDLYLTLHVPPTVPVRRVVDAIQETYPTTGLVRRRQVSREDTAGRVHRVITEELTDRQRGALEAAVYSGFFEWPREASGEDVADSLDVAAPTFHQHLRKGQRKVFEAVFPAASET